jgi:hypothetical protein
MVISEKGGGIAEENPKSGLGQKPPISRKLIAVVLVLIMVAASSFTVWFVFFRNWTIRDVAAAVINDTTPSNPGFKHSLAGKTVTVEGKITNITIEHTNQGDIYLAELDGFEDFNLVFWGGFPHEIGNRITAKVSFEWSVCNDERHVYSPQISFPNIMSLNSIDIMSNSYDSVNGVLLTKHELPSGKVNVSVDYVDEPIPLSVANCSLLTGRASWARELMDFFGAYKDNNKSDYISNLTQNLGPNGTLAFTDANSDDYLDRGDYFTISGLPRPSMESGAYTFMLSVEWRERLPMQIYDPSRWTEAYIIMNHKGLMSMLDTPVQGRLLTTTLHDKMRGELAYLESYKEVPWDDVSILLSDGNNYATWSVSSGSLNSTHAMNVTLPTRPLGALMISCNVTDREGNGRFDVSDMTELTSIGATHLSNSTSYTMTVLYKPMGTEICRANFWPEVVPVSNMTASILQDGRSLTFGPMHTGHNLSYSSIGVPWDEISIELSDGNRTVKWTPEEMALGTGSACTEPLAALSLGNITIRCNITDLDGNGWVNRGDRFTLRTTGPDEFPTSHIYSVRVAYEPVPGDVFNCTFRG